MKNTMKTNCTNRMNKKQLLLIFSVILTVGTFAGCTKEEKLDGKNNYVGFSSSKSDEKTQSTTADSENYPATSSKTSSSQSGINTPATFTQTQAEDIALAHAGIARADVTYIHTEKDYERSYTEYDVEFRVGNYEYSYEINADTGSIVSSEKEIERANAPQTTQNQPAQTQPAQTTTPPVNAATAELTQTQAEDIALAHAGISRADVTYIHTEKDYERSYTEYDVEFRVGNYEYSYEINADTGSIVSSEKEYEDEYDFD